MPMNPEIKAKWIAALRSGKYKQGRGALHCISSDTYCCLGVLCSEMNIARKDTATVQMYTIFDFGYDQVSGSLPNKFATDIGLVAQYEDHLIVMNDDKQRSFTEIAQYIEDNL